MFYHMLIQSMLIILIKIKMVDNLDEKSLIELHTKFHLKFIF